MICPMMQEHSLLLKSSVVSQVPEDAILKIRRRKKCCKLNLSTVSVLANRSLHQDLMHSGCHETMVPNVCLWVLTLSLPYPRDFFTLSLNREPVHRLKKSWNWKCQTQKKPFDHSRQLNPECPPPWASKVSRRSTVSLQLVTKLLRKYQQN